jgi:hypothetical protein
MNPLLVLQARAEARAILFEAGEYEDSDAAMGPLVAYAYESGLEEELGLDVVLDVIGKAFEK